jgi:hypothetical protein
MNCLRYIGFLACVCLILSQDSPAEFQFEQSSLQAFYYFFSVTIEGEAVESDDWVGVFKGDICVGTQQWDTDPENCGGGVCAVPVMGYDSFIEETVGYMVADDIPSFKIYDASEDEYYEAIPSDNIPWENMGMPIIDNLIANVDLSISGTGHLSPDNYYISNVYPNPFNPITNIGYNLPESSTIELNVYNMNGRHIQTLVSGFQTTGYYSINWNASNYPSGVYLIRMEGGDPSASPRHGFTQTQKIVLVK